MLLQSWRQNVYQLELNMQQLCHRMQMSECDRAQMRLVFSLDMTVIYSGHAQKEPKSS